MKYRLTCSTRGISTNTCKEDQIWKTITLMVFFFAIVKGSSIILKNFMKTIISKRRQWIVSLATKINLKIKAGPYSRTRGKTIYQPPNWPLKKCKGPLESVGRTCLQIFSISMPTTVDNSPVSWTWGSITTLQTSGSIIGEKSYETTNNTVWEKWKTSCLLRKFRNYRKKRGQFSNENSFATPSIFGCIL